MTVDDIVRHLRLEPHPEGGFYRETFRDTLSDAGGRAASTAIYFLLPAGVTSHWHRVDAAEVWHWYAGDPLELSVAEHLDGKPTMTVLGNGLAVGQIPQAVVPAGHWQQAKSLGRGWTLVGCTVAPGFLFEKFEIAPGD